jgi:hypothetical protein
MPSPHLFTSFKLFFDHLCIFRMMGAFGSRRAVGFPREWRDRASGIEIATMLFV